MPLLEALPSAQAIPLERDLISGCLDPEEELDRRFARACTDSLAALPPWERRGALAGVTGHIGESVVEVALDGHGWSPVWHFTGPGRHGVDLLLLGPGAERLVAVEVKATLRPELGYKVALTGDFTSRLPVVGREQLDDLDWLDR